MLLSNQRGCRRDCLLRRLSSFVRWKHCRGLHVPHFENCLLPSVSQHKNELQRVELYTINYLEQIVLSLDFVLIFSGRKLTRNEGSGTRMIRGVVALIAKMLVLVVHLH